MNPIVYCAFFTCNESTWFMVGVLSLLVVGGVTAFVAIGMLVDYVKRIIKKED